jgi:hypothetical protein
MFAFMTLRMAKKIVPAGLVILLGMAVGCGVRAPYDISKVSGKITYHDGTLVKAARMSLRFIPQDPATGKFRPNPATAEVDLDTGMFDCATTWKYGDGVPVGRHKVVVDTWKKMPDGSEQPVPVVPKKFTNAKDTPLEANVVKRGENHFVFEIDKLEKTDKL